MTVKTIKLSKRIKGREILNNINIVAESGAVTGLRGVNGSGKTMLLRAIAGLIRPTDGIIEIDGCLLGVDIELPQSMGLLIENPSFLNNRTGFNNLSLLASIKGIIGEQEIREALIRVGLDPNDRRAFKKYSLGMKQRLGIAAAVMEHPSILLLDEPTNALDDLGIEMLRELIRQERQRGATILLASHDASFLDGLADSKYLIENGQLSPQN